MTFKLPKPAAWLLNGEVYVVKQCKLLGKNPGEEIPGQIPLYTAHAVRDALEEAAQACDALGQKYRDLYKGRTAPTECALWYDPHTDGLSDAAWECEVAIREMIGETK